LFGGSGPVWEEAKAKLLSVYRWTEWEHTVFDQCGVRIRQLSDCSFELDQAHYCSEIEVPVISRDRRRQQADALTTYETRLFRAGAGAIQWRATQIRPQYSAELGLPQSKTTTATVADLIQLIKLISKVKEEGSMKIRIHAFPPGDKLVLVMWGDAAFANRCSGESTEGRILGCATQSFLEGNESAVSLISWRSAKLDRVSRSPPGAEVQAIVNAEDELTGARFALAELLGQTIDISCPWKTVAQVPGLVMTDSKDLFDRMRCAETLMRGKELRTGLELMSLRQGVRECGTMIRWIHSDAMLANSLTKPSEPQQLALFYKLSQRWRLIFDEKFMSARRRKQHGLSPLDVNEVDETTDETK
jgi:hypothetical protein